MKKLDPTLLEAFDENVLVKTIFQQKDGKLKIVKKNVRLNSSAAHSATAFFPISKERK